MNGGPNPQGSKALGDAEFKHELVACLPNVRAFARALCRGREFADDLAQDAILKAWAARGSYAAGTNFKAWLFTIVRNQFFNDRRKMARVVAWDEEAMGKRLVVQQNQEAAIEVADLHRALFTLPAEQREALLLVGAGGFSYEEVAIIAGCAIGTVKSRVNRARASLAKAMEAPQSQSRVKSEKAVDDIFAGLDRLAADKL